MRGEYAAIHEAVVDDPDFKGLSAQAKCCWYTLKLMLGASGIDLMRASRAVLADLTGLERQPLHDALNELVAGRWLIVQDDVLWLRNGLLHNPNMKLTNENHRKAIVKHIAGLPRCEIVNAFAAYYKIPAPFDGIPSEWDTQWYREGIPDQDVGRRTEEEDTGGTKTTAPAAPAAGVENSGDIEVTILPRPAFTLNQMAEAARLTLGLGCIDSDDHERNKRLLREWLYSSAKRKPEDIMAAIEGLAHMRDNDLVGWPSAKPGTPMLLSALVKATTLDHTGDGAPRLLWDVAIEHQRRRETAGPTRAPTTHAKGSPMQRAKADLPARTA